MKHIKLFEQFLNEGNSLIKIEKLIPGVQFEESEIDFDSEEYKSVESYFTNVPGISGDYGEDDLYLNIYDGNSFCFFHDSAPVSTSLHNDKDRDTMDHTQSEVPKPLNKLNKKIFDEVVKEVKERNGVEESRVVESNSELGSKAKKFSDDVEDMWEYFVDAEHNEKEKGSKLPKQWYEALKTLEIKAGDSAICFFEAWGDRQEVLNFAKKRGLKFVEVEDRDTEDRVGSSGIVFSFKQ